MSRAPSSSWIPTVVRSPNRWLPAADEHELVVIERPHLDVRVAELTHQSEIDLAAQRQIEDLLRVAGPDDEPHIREPSRVADEQRRQDVRADRGRRTQDELAGPAAAELRAAGSLRHRARPSHAPHRAGTRGPRRSDPCRADREGTRRCPSSDSSAWILAVNAGWRHVQRTGGAAEIAMAGDLEEALDLAEEHGSAISRYQ